MFLRSNRLYLLDMQQGCRDILDFTAGMESGQELQADRRTMLAVTRCFEIIGEAARQTGASFQLENPAIAWQEIVSFRNVMAHEYFGVDFEIVWDVIQNEIPPLWEKVSLLLDQLPADQE